MNNEVCSRSKHPNIGVTHTWREIMENNNEADSTIPPSKRPRGCDDEGGNHNGDGDRTSQMALSPSDCSQKEPVQLGPAREQQQNQQQDAITSISDLPDDLIIKGIMSFVIDCRLTCNNIAFTNHEIRNAILTKVDLPWPTNIVLGDMNSIRSNAEDANNDEFERYDDDIEFDSDNGGDNEDDNSSSSSASTCDDGFGSDADHADNQVGNEEEPAAKPCILVTTTTRTGRDGYVGVCSSYGTLADAMDDRGGYDADRFLNCHFDIWNCQTGTHFHKRCPREYVLQIQFSPTHPYIFLSSHHDGRVVIWDLRLSLSESSSTTGAYDGMMAVNIDATSTRSKSVLLQERQELEFPDEITNIHFAPNGLLALIHSYEFSLWSYCTNTHRMTCLKRYDMSGDIPATNFSAFTTTRTPSWCCSDNNNYDGEKDNNHIIAVGQLLEGISLWKLPEASLSTSSTSSKQRFSDDNYSTIPDSRSELSKIQITSMPITVFPFRKMGFSPSSGLLPQSSSTKQLRQQYHKSHLAVMIGDRYIQLITIPDGIEVRRLTSPTRISDFAFSLHGDKIAILTLGVIIIYDVETLKIVSRVIPSDRIDGDVGEVLSFAFASETSAENIRNTDRRHVLAVVCKGSKNNGNVCCLLNV